GVEWRCLKEALLYDLKRGRLARGGSTITQQLAKNLYLSPSKNPLRKVRELVLTYRLEKVLSKRRIFEVYLNVVEWGSGIFGAEAAARAYFGKPASELTLDESASLAAILPSPRRHDPRSGSRWVELRKQWVYRRMAESQRLPDLSAPSAEPEPPPPPPEEDEPETEEGEVAVESSTGPETAPASRNPAPPSPL
ncbi:MAG TPA: biosynthetic peptidoglycan transglycosylase, partial [Elusimicrobiota bacterium]|nr:biosynthetic peptidoglycan transglycosylase [Elusimicrobiota bacterium]